MVCLAAGTQGMCTVPKKRHISGEHDTSQQVAASLQPKPTAQPAPQHLTAVKTVSLASTGPSSKVPLLSLAASLLGQLPAGVSNPKASPVLGGPLSEPSERLFPSPGSAFEVVSRALSKAAPTY